jgi:hypothetical protein
VVAVVVSTVDGVDTGCDEDSVNVTDSFDDATTTFVIDEFSSTADDKKDR